MSRAKDFRKIKSGDAQLYLSEVCYVFYSWKRSSDDFFILNFSSTAFDTSVVAAIQHLAQQNRQQISALQAETNFLKKLQHNNNNNASTTHARGQPQANGDTTTQQNTMLDNLHNHLMTLQEEQVRLAGQLANMLDDTKDEFIRKQVLPHIFVSADYT